MDLSDPQPSTSGSSETPADESNAENAEEVKRKRKEELKAYHKSLASSEKVKIQNANKIRLRKLPRLGNRPPHLAAIQVLNNLFETELTPADIVDCQRVQSWLGQEPTELVVTFVNEDIRNYVYNKRTKENKGFTIICDELGEERLEVWRKLVYKYGLKRVYTYCGAVHLDVGGKCARFLTLRELDKFEANNE